MVINAMTSWSIIALLIYHGLWMAMAMVSGGWEHMGALLVAAGFVPPTDSYTHFD